MQPRQDETADDAYDLAPSEAPPPPMPAPVRRMTPTPAASNTGSQPASTLGYRARGDDQTKALTDTDKIKNFQMPLWLLGGGIVIEVLALIFRGASATTALQHVGGELIVGTIVMLAGILLAARARQINLGTFWTAVFKLAAISVAPAALADLASPLLSLLPFLVAALIGWGFQFVFYFALLGALFDLDESDTWYCVWVIFLVRLAVYFVFLWLAK